MNKLPTSFPGFSDSIYAGFWLRLGSLLLDAVIYSPFILLIEYINGFSRIAYFFTLPVSLTLFFFYYVYCVKKWGGTPGKLILNLKIVKINGRPIDWREAVLRHCISIIYSIVGVIFMTIALSQISDELFDKLSYVQRGLLIASISPVSIRALNLANNIWILSELVVLLFNKRKMALHDYIASTVVIRGLYFKRLQDWLDRQDGTEIACPGCERTKVVKRYGNFECSKCNTKFNFSRNGIIMIE